MCVAKYWDDLWLGVKGQSNLDIAGFPRNIFRYSVEMKSKKSGVEHSLYSGGHCFYQLQRNSEYGRNISAVRLWALRSMVERETALIER